MIRVGRVIPGVLAEVIRKAPLCPEKIAFAWRESVGPAISRVSSVQRDEHGVLRVTVEAAWAPEIRRSSRLILGRLERLLGTGVISTIDTVTTPTPPSRSRR